MELAYCGLNCEECLIYLASASRNSCHSGTVSEKMCGGCEIRSCGIEKDCGNCAKCAEFPCSILEKYIGGDSDRMNCLKQLAAKYKETD